MHTYLMATIAYIQENGDELERARLAGLLGRSRAEPKVARSLLARQNEDGGFPYGLIQGRPSAITATATAMQWMHHLRLLPSYVERATGYLLTVQRPDGAWEESPAALRFDPPALIRPGVPLARLLTLQRPDGGWSSDDGADRDVDLSLRASGVLLAYGVSTA